MYSETILSLLRASGWTPDRKVPTAQWVDRLEFEGFCMLPRAVTILEEFGGLRIEPQEAAPYEYRADVLLFDPLMAASGEFDKIEGWQLRLKTRLSPVAENADSILVIAEDGRVFSCWFRRVLFHGNSFEDAMENELIAPKRRPIEYCVINK